MQKRMLHTLSAKSIRFFSFPESTCQDSPIPPFTGEPLSTDP